MMCLWISFKLNVSEIQYTSQLNGFRMSASFYSKNRTNEKTNFSNRPPLKKKYKFTLL